MDPTRRTPSVVAPARRARLVRSSKLRHVARWLVWGVVAVLGAFHVDLLAARLADGSFSEPRVAGRWMATLALVAWLAWMRARGTNPLRGRGGVAFWLLVALLHAVPGAPMAPVVVASLEAATSGPLATGVLLVLAAWIGAIAAAGTAEASVRRRPDPSLGRRRRRAVVTVPPRAPPA